MKRSLRKFWRMSETELTPEAVYRDRARHRREFLQEMGLTGLVLGMFGLAGCQSASDEEIKKAGEYSSKGETVGSRSEVEKRTDGNGSSPYPAKRNEKYAYGREETEEKQAAQFTNFYEFTGPFTKQSWRYVGQFKPDPWAITVDGLCAKPQKFDFDDLLKTFTLEERAYRHRCVETWAMAVPWTGFPLRELLSKVEPLPEAKFVAFETFSAKSHPGQAEYMESTLDTSPWPYTEGLTMDEAKNELVLLATGIYGHSLPKQHGAPIRLVVPWKYGFKGIKSIVRISLVAEQPKTYWNTIAPNEYDFEANVNPEIPHPRWSQATEWMLGSKKRFETIKYNGYGEYVAELYA